MGSPIAICIFFSHNTTNSRCLDSSQQVVIIYYPYYLLILSHENPEALNTTVWYVCPFALSSMIVEVSVFRPVSVSFALFVTAYMLFQRTIDRRG